MTRAERVRAASARLEALLRDVPEGIDPHLARVLTPVTPGSLVDVALVTQPAVGPLALLLEEYAGDLCDEPECSACGRFEVVAIALLRSDGPS